MGCFSRFHGPCRGVRGIGQLTPCCSARRSGRLSTLPLAAAIRLRSRPACCSRGICLCLRADICTAGIVASIVKGWRTRIALVNDIQRRIELPPAERSYCRPARWSVWLEIGGRLRSEQVVDLRRNTHTEGADFPWITGWQRHAPASVRITSARRTQHERLAISSAELYQPFRPPMNVWRPRKKASAYRVGRISRRDRFEVVAWRDGRAVAGAAKALNPSWTPCWQSNALHTIRSPGRGEPGTNAPRSRRLLSAIAAGRRRRP